MADALSGSKRPLQLPAQISPAHGPELAAYLADIGVPKRQRAAVAVALRAIGLGYMADRLPRSRAAYLKLADIGTSHAAFKLIERGSNLPVEVIRERLLTLDHLKAAQFVELDVADARFSSAPAYSVLHGAAALERLSVPIYLARYYDAEERHAAVAGLLATVGQLRCHVPLVSLDHYASVELARCPEVLGHEFVARVSRFWNPNKEAKTRWLGRRGPEHPENIAVALGPRCSIRPFQMSTRRVLFAYGPTPQGHYYIHSSQLSGREAEERLRELVEMVESSGASPMKELRIEALRIPRKPARSYVVFVQLIIVACHWPLWKRDRGGASVKETA